MVKYSSSQTHLRKQEQLRNRNSDILLMGLQHFRVSKYLGPTKCIIAKNQYLSCLFLYLSFFFHPGFRSLEFSLPSTSGRHGWVPGSPRVWRRRCVGQQSPALPPSVLKLSWDPSPGVPAATDDHYSKEKAFPWPSAEA